MHFDRHPAACRHWLSLSLRSIALLALDCTMQYRCARAPSQSKHVRVVNVCVVVVGTSATELRNRAPSFFAVRSYVTC
jgi:hypothetical protein